MNWAEAVDRAKQQDAAAWDELYAGKGMVVIHDEPEFQYRRSRLPQEQFMVQKLIGDDEHEYTRPALLLRLCCRLRRRCQVRR